MSNPEKFVNNCYYCKHLEWCDDDSEVSNNSGYVCHKREYMTSDAEDRHLEKLNSPSYLRRKKKCAEQREPK
jgi:hypothetical protein